MKAYSSSYFLAILPARFDFSDFAAVCNPAGEGLVALEANAMLVFRDQARANRAFAKKKKERNAQLAT